MNSETAITPRVSVIMPAYNAADTIRDSIQSLLDQSESSWELLLVVDCNSSDETLQIARDYAQEDPRIQLITDLEKGGCVFNRNAAIRQARGEFIAMLDSDDLWEPEKLKLQLELMDQTECDFTCAGYRQIDESGQSLGIEVIPPETITYEDLLRVNLVGCLTVMIRRSRFPDLQFVEFLHEDYILWLQILRETPARTLPQVLASYRVATTSRSGNKIKAAVARWRILREYEKLSLARAVPLFLEYATDAMLKRSPAKKLMPVAR